ncbi:hypothetical protein O181_038518, partial [Austropuccinia psidii MF-1]|nr:hypothetical protein [Austropuccinia psidii MF-1]
FITENRTYTVRRKKRHSLNLNIWQMLKKETLALLLEQDSAKKRSLNKIIFGRKEHFIS